MRILITGSPENLVHLAGSPYFEFIRYDAANFIFVHRRIDPVMHIASPANSNPASPFGYPNLPIQTMKAGALGTHNTLGVAQAFNARHLLASTSDIPGDPEQHPQIESYWGHLDPIGSRSVYDEAKRFAEAITMAYHRYHGLDTRNGRIFNTYGPRMRLDDGRVVANFILQALRGEPLTIFGDGALTRSFCYVSDLIEGICRLLFSDEHDPVNIGNPAEISILEFAQTINRIVNNNGGIITREELRLSDDPQRRQPDITRAKPLLNWAPTVPLYEGIQKPIEYYKEESPQL